MTVRTPPPSPPLPAPQPASQASDVPTARAGPDPGSSSATIWEASALECVPAKARRVLVLAAESSPEPQPASPTSDGASLIVRRRVPAIRDGEDVARACHGPVPWDAVVLGPGVVESGERAASDLDAARQALVPGGRLVVVTADAERALVIEKSLLEIGCAIRLEKSLPGSATSEPTETLHLFAAQCDGYTVRAAAPGDESAILELFASSFHVQRSLEHWRWKYRQNPYGNGRISLAFSPARELVGQYCAYPVRLYRRSAGTAVIHQVGDTMTARAARGIGRGPTSVYARAARHFYAAFCRGRVAFNYGFNTGNIQQLSIRFADAHKVAEVSYWELDTTSWTPRRGRLRRWLDGYLDGYKVREIGSAQEMGPSFDDLYASTRDSYDSLIERDRRYLGWRYLERPDVRYRVLGVERRGRCVGWGVFARRDRDLIWGDALFAVDHAGAARELLQAALRDAGDPRPERVVAWFSAHPSWWSSTLLELGFEARPEPQTLGLMVVPFLDPDAPRWAARSFYYAYGDSDLF